DYTIQIDSGDWYYVRGGSVRTGESQAVGTIGNVSIIINGGRITNTTTSKTMNGIVAVAGFDALDGFANIEINGGEINCSVMGLGRPGTNATGSNSAYAHGDVTVTITGGKFRKGITVGAVHDTIAGELTGDFTLAVSGGDFSGAADFNAESVLGKATLITTSSLAPTAVDFDETVTVAGASEVATKLNAILDANKVVVNLPDVTAKSDVIYVMDDGNGDGSTPKNALGDIVAATEKLKNGGTIVIAGKVSVDLPKTLRKTSGKLTVTSTYGGVDYAALNNAHIELTKSIAFNSDTLIENIKIVSKGNDCYLSAEGNEFTVGDGVVCEIFKGNRCEDYPDLIAGSFSLATSLKKDIHITVKSGTWGSISGAQFSTVENSGITRRVEGNIVIDVYGGKFTDDCFIAGINNLNGNATLNAYGGTFACSVFGIVGQNVTVNGDVTLNGYDAEFQGDIRAAQDNQPTLNGKFVFNVHSADITRASVIIGANELKGNNTSEINVAENIDLNKELSGDITFQNPIAGYADPSIVYHDGYYYYTYAATHKGTDALWMAKAANLCDIGKVEPILICSQATTGQGKEMTALWAPQLYFMDGRWYIYGAAQTD
ncbi:MAG: family 43 glycosylhydrolase, partial [Clostridia bacterium]|nr:family 43 glycosylhydrolase [Clostridia bacterium]